MQEEVLKVKRHALYFQADLENNAARVHRRNHKANVVEDIGYWVEVKGFWECIELFSHLR